MEPRRAPIGPKRLKNIDTMGSLVNPACQTERAPPGTLPSVGRQFPTDARISPYGPTHISLYQCMATWMAVMHSSDLRCRLGVQNGGYAALRALRARY